MKQEFDSDKQLHKTLEKFNEIIAECSNNKEINIIMMASKKERTTIVASENVKPYTEIAILLNAICGILEQHYKFLPIEYRIKMIAKMMIEIMKDDKLEVI